LSTWESRRDTLEWGIYRDIWGSPVNGVYAACEDGLLHYDGNNWNQTTLEEVFLEDRDVPIDSFHVSGLWGFAETDVWAIIIYQEENSVDEKCILYHYGGDSWSEFDIYFQNVYFDLWGLHSDELYIVGEGVIHLRFAVE